MKVLVVEDDVRIAALLRKGLTMAGHLVETTHLAADGKRLVANGHFDVLILDVKLPDYDGIALCKKLRDEGLETPILMLTARDSIDDKVAGLTVGADDYLTKPFSFQELLARLTALNRRPAQFVNSNVLTVRDVDLFPDRSEVVRNGRTISLTRKEFAVLELLLRNTNQVLSRELILDRVWGTDAEPIANVVDAVIARLRTKLDKGFKKPLIKTVRGLGYKVES